MSGPPKLRLVAFNDVYSLTNLPKIQTFLSKLSPAPTAVILAGDFLSPSTLSALDGGKGMVATLRAAGVTHATLGNHEADLRLPVLQKRLTEFKRSSIILNSNVGRYHGSFPRTPPTKAPWFTQIMNDYSILTTPCGRVRVALIGLLSDEHAVFRDAMFRGIPIDPVTSSYDRLYEQLLLQKQSVCKSENGRNSKNKYGSDLRNTSSSSNSSSSSSSTESESESGSKRLYGGHADLILPVTHQSIFRDHQLAEHMLKYVSSSPQSPGGINLIIGGHEHEFIDRTVYKGEDSSDKYVRIVKSGCEAQAVSVIDLTFEPSNGSDNPGYIADMNIDLVDMLPYENSVFVQQIVDSHHALLNALDNEPIVHDANALLPPSTPLSSESTRYRQTTVGALFCTAIKEELEVDVAIINGAPIKGNKIYNKATMSYAELKQELPFPCKMVVVPMKRWELHEAIHYSRTCPTQPDEEPGRTDVMRRGYLQVDIEFDRLGFHTGGQDDDLMVALPRNLMKGFCDIRPLMEMGQRLDEQGLLPGDDDFIPAINVIVRHFCRERWYDIVRDNYSFGDLDKGHKGYLSRNDVRRMLRNAMGHNPADFVVDDMIAAIDADENGVVDPGEFSHFLATMERERGMVRFD